MLFRNRDLCALIMNCVAPVRVAPLQNLTASEFLEAKISGVMSEITVKGRHKTKKTYGAAKIGCPNPIYDKLKIFVEDIKTKFPTEENIRAFPTITGGPCQIGPIIAKLGSQILEKKISSNSFRRHMAQWAYDNDASSNCYSEAMLHSVETSRKHYLTNRRASRFFTGFRVPKHFKLNRLFSIADVYDACEEENEDIVEQETNTEAAVSSFFCSSNIFKLIINN